MTQSELALEGHRGRSELRGDIENEAEEDQDGAQDRDDLAGMAGRPGGNKIGHGQMVHLGRFGAQLGPEPEPDRDIAGPDTRHHPERRDTHGIDETGKAEQHPGRGRGCRIAEARHPGAQLSSTEEKIAFGLVATGRPDADADQDKLVGDQGRQHDHRIRHARFPPQERPVPSRS